MASKYKISKGRKQIIEYLEYIFEKKDEFEFAKEIIFKCINSKGYGFEILKADVIGHKRRVINTFREYDIFPIKTQKHAYYILVSETSKASYYLGRMSIPYVLKKLKHLKEIKMKKQEHKSDKRYICASCEYKWETRKGFGEPAKCPKCNSTNIISFKKLRDLINHA